MLKEQALRLWALIFGSHLTSILLLLTHTVNEDGLTRFLILMCTLIGDKRVINQMIREQVFESLAFYLKRTKYIPVIEGLPEEV